MKDWSPFVVTSKRHAPSPRKIDTRDGIGDRLRAAAFAEFQARDAFEWAAETFESAPSELRMAWLRLARAEDRHMSWLLSRMKELDIKVKDRPVSDHLWHSLLSAKSAKEFSHFMASAEDRGRQAGERFYREMLNADAVSAEIFRKIAEEEVEHIELAQKFYGPKIGPVLKRKSEPPLNINR